MSSYYDQRLRKEFKLQHNNHILQSSFSCLTDEEVYINLHLKIVLLDFMWSSNNWLK